jgi:hypothetical protein
MSSSPRFSLPVPTPQFYTPILYPLLMCHAAPGSSLYEIRSRTSIRPDRKKAPSLTCVSPRARVPGDHRRAKESFIPTSSRGHVSHALSLLFFLLPFVEVQPSSASEEISSADELTRLSFFLYYWFMNRSGRTARCSPAAALAGTWRINRTACVFPSLLLFRGLCMGRKVYILIHVAHASFCSYRSRRLLRASMAYPSSPRIPLLQPFPK